MPRLYSLVVVLGICAAAPAADWPQWLGPRRDGVSPETVSAWQGGLDVLWRQPAGEGHSSPVVAGGKVYLHARVRGKDEEEVTARDAASGKLLWRSVYPRAPFSSLFGNGPRATPAVVDGRVYTFGVTGVLSCFRADSGDRLWQVDTLARFRAPNLTFGMSGSPLVVGDKVLVAVGAKGASVVACNRETGAVAWKALDDPASYSSPIVLGRGKDRQVILITQQGVVALDPDGGRLLWRFPLTDLLNETSSTPVRVDDLLVASTVTFGGVALRLESKEGRPAVTPAWKNPDLTCYFSTPVAAGRDRLFLVTGKFLPPPEATLRCVEAGTGKELWHKKAVGKYHAALIRTGNDRLLMLADGGTLVLLDPAADGYRELARARVCGETWAHPALADGRLYVRDDKELICLRLGQK